MHTNSSRTAYCFSEPSLQEDIVAYLHAAHMLLLPRHLAFLHPPCSFVAVAFLLKHIFLIHIVSYSSSFIWDFSHILHIFFAAPVNKR